MRDDMAKIVTDRPRRGHAGKSKKTTGRPIRRYDPEADLDQSSTRFGDAQDQDIVLAR